MTETEYLLTCLAEECAEVAQRVSKALRFSLSEIQTGQNLTNAERIMAEYADLRAVYSMLAARNIVPLVDHELMDTKREKVQGYLDKYLAERLLSKCDKCGKTPWV